MSNDQYAARYMRGRGRVLLRDAIVGRKLFALLGGVTLWCGAGAVASFLGALPKASLGASLFVTALAALFAFLTITMTVVRSVVSEGELHVQYGMWGPRIPIERIRESRVVPFDWTRYSGWGIRRSFDGSWAYVARGGGDVVEVTWIDDAGAKQTVQFSAKDPRAVVEAIERARAGAKPKVRVATDGVPRAGDSTAEDEEAALLRAAEDEVEAALDEARRGDARRS